MDINRKTAFLILRDVASKRAFSHIAVSNHIANFSPSSPQFVRELAYGVIREMYLLDYIIGHYVKTSIEKLHINDHTLLRMGLFQLKYMDSVPEYAAVNESVNLAAHYAKGREGFVNGVLRHFIRDKCHVDLPHREADEVRYLSTLYS
jgi:16S rRNA (cytosine967-C5)-methyltransferase